MSRVSARVIIPTQGAERDFPLVEFQTAMAVFRGRYVIAKMYYDLHDIDPEILDEQQVLTACAGIPVMLSNMRGLSSSVDGQISAGFEWLNPAHDLLVSEMDRSNPVDLLLSGLAAALAGAVILSGGELQFGSMLRVKLPPIGDGILKLRSALGPMRIPEPQPPGEDRGRRARPGSARG
jgi:hypothetical protein